MSVVPVAEPQKIRRSGNSYVVTIPADVIERHGLKQDDLVRIQLQVLDVIPRVATD